MMTSFAFILGVVPLVISIGAGAEMRRILGKAVFCGMLGVTIFGTFSRLYFTTSYNGWLVCAEPSGEGDHLKGGWAS